jgi:ribosomal protein S18 acetylase RimI-like enzyme
MAKLHVQCWREAYSAIVPPDLAARFDVVHMIVRWQEHLGKSDRHIQAAYDGEHSVGFVNSGSPVEKIHDDMDGHIAALYVAQSHYRQGLGRKLMGCAAAGWLAQGGHSITLGVLAENVRARSFYEAVGGRLVKTGIYDWHGHRLEDAIYIFENLPQLAASAGL